MTSYVNPIIPGFHPDPSICRVGQDYYLVTSSFEFFPGVPVFHSRDLVHWRQIGHCLTRPSQLPLENALASAGIYAPTIRYQDGTFYMVTTLVQPERHFYVTAKDPAGPWSEPVWLPGPGIDPSFLFEDDKCYFTHNAPDGIYQREIDPSSGKDLTAMRKIWGGWGGMYPEGSHLYKINGMYYLMCAEGGTEYGHMETIARSSNPYGPFESYEKNPILSHRSWFSPIAGTGHADLVEDHNGNWWLVFLAFRPVGYPPAYHLGRETFLAPVTWNADGWPVVNGNGRVTLEMDGPLPETHRWLADPVRDDFVLPELGLCWNYLRNPDMKDYSLTEHPGWLRLKGSKVSLDDKSASPAWVGRRQEHFDCRVAALLDFDPKHDNEEAGLVVWLNERHHYEIAVARRDGARRLVVRQRIGRLSTVFADRELADGPLTLRIAADKNLYHFAYETESGKTLQLPKADGETRYLSTEVGGMFTGVYFAMYATGNGQTCHTPADFDWFEYQAG